MQDAGGEAGSGPSSPAQSEAADRGRLRMLKHQLDEAKQRLEKSERDAQARHRALEATVEQLQAQLLQRDQALAEVRPATSQAESPHQVGPGVTPSSSNDVIVCYRLTRARRALATELSAAHYWRFSPLHSPPLKLSLC